MKPTFVTIDNMKSINENYGIIEYNGIDLYVTSDLTKFNADKLFKAFKTEQHDDGSKTIRLSFSNWKEHAGKTLCQVYKDKLEYICGKGTKDYKGWYVDFHLFYNILFSIDPLKGQLWIDGKDDWNNYGKDGVVYLLQKKEHVGTNIYKIGQSKDLTSRLNVYGKGTHVYGITKVSNVSLAEKKLKEWFDNHEAIKMDDIGNEYYQCGSFDEACNLFEYADLGDLILKAPKMFQMDEKVN